MRHENGLCFRRAGWSYGFCLALVMGAPQAGAQFCPDDGTIFPSSDANTSDPATTLRTCDINQDGHIDLLTANDGTRTVSVILNNGDGTFAAPTRWLTGPAPAKDETINEPVDVTCCDVDGDGHLDLVAANRTADNVAVLFNDGTEQFSGPVTYPVGEAPWAVRCTPLDGDPHPDLLVANFTSDSVSVLLNNGDGTFAPHVEHPAGDAPFALALCDVNGDALLDVVSANFGDKTVSVFDNPGDGTLNAARTFSLCADPLDCAANPFDVTCCDLDGVNGPDIITADAIADTITALFNDGSGSFGTAQATPAGDGPISVACCDVDTDGDLDVLSANLTSDDVGVLLNDGTGEVAVSRFLPVGTANEQNPSAVVCFDVESDSDLDLATSFAGGTQLFENACVVDCTDDQECDDGNPCTDDFCDADGLCQRVDSTDPCDDGDPCTINDTCSAGRCVGEPVDCDDGDACTTDTCDPNTGECVNDPSDCNDHDLCTIDSCDTETGCVNQPISCDDGDACTVDGCDPDTGECFHDPIDCDDGDVCTTDICDPDSNECINDPIDCDDNNACTADSCDPSTGCVNTPTTDPCDDGDPCTVDDVCSDGECAGVPIDCDDGVACTVDSCDSSTGACVNDPDDAFCDDGLFCTGAEFCDPNTGCVTPGNPCPDPADCDEEADNCGCVTPMVVVAGPRYLDVTPADLPGAVALFVTGAEADVSCVSGYVQSDGRVGATPVFKPSAGTDGWNTVHVRGEQLVSGRRYAVAADCDANNPATSLSPPAEGTLWRTADTDNNATIDLVDIVKVIDGFVARTHTVLCNTDEDCVEPAVPPHFTCDQSVGRCLWITTENVDLIGDTSCLPDRTVSVRDVIVALDQFTGQPQPCRVSCP